MLCLVLRHLTEASEDIRVLVLKISKALCLMTLMGMLKSFLDCRLLLLWFLGVINMFHHATILGLL